MAVTQELQKVPIAFSAEQYEWLRGYAFSQRVPMAKVVRDALDEYRGRVDPQLQLPITREAGT